MKTAILVILIEQSILCHKTALLFALGQRKLRVTLAAMHLIIRNS